MTFTTVLIFTYDLQPPVAPPPQILKIKCAHHDPNYGGRTRPPSRNFVFSNLNCNPFSILGWTDSMLAAALLAVVNSMKSSFFPSRLPDVGTLHFGFQMATLTVFRLIPGSFNCNLYLSRPVWCVFCVYLSHANYFYDIKIFTLCQNFCTVQLKWKILTFWIRNGAIYVQ